MLLYRIFEGLKSCTAIIICNGDNLILHGIPMLEAMDFVMGLDVMPPAHTREPYGTLTTVGGSEDGVTLPSLVILGAALTFISTYSDVTSVTALPV